MTSEPRPLEGEKKSLAGETACATNASRMLPMVGQAVWPANTARERFFLTFSRSRLSRMSVSDAQSLVTICLILLFGGARSGRSFRHRVLRSPVAGEAAYFHFAGKVLVVDVVRH